MKLLYFYLSAFSFLGTLLLIKKNTKIGIMILTIILFGLIWRNLNNINSSRYYSIFLLAAVSLSAYAIDSLFSLMQQRFSLLLSLFLLLLSLSIHLIKCFSGFRNNYVLDLREDVEAISRKESNSIIFINSKEFKRIGQVAHGNRIIKLSSNRYYDFTDLYIENCLFYDPAYLIISVDASPDTVGLSASVQEPSLRRYSKIENHFSNTEHSKCVSVYRHSPYVPSSDCDLSEHYASPILRSYIPEYDTFIYQVQNKIVWLIGKEINPQTEIVYHLVTDKPHLLPEWRRHYNFDNRGFRSGDKWERECIGRYRVFEKEIPSEFPITSIRVGFDLDGNGVIREFLFDNNYSESLKIKNHGLLNN